jgi:hypothetical protein
MKGAQGETMSTNQQVNEVAVDRREETVVTPQPRRSVAKRFRVTRDGPVEVESRQSLGKALRIAWTLLAILEILLAFRFVLHLMGANPDSGFTIFIYGITGAVTAPFNSLLGTPSAAAGSVFEVTTLIAMAVYALFFWLVMRVIRIAVDRPSARTATRSVHEQMPDGSNRTTRSTTIG